MSARSLACLAMVAALLSASSLSATLVVEDNFNSYTPGTTIAGPNWNPKWVAGTQQNLFQASASGGYAVLNTSVAERLYHIPNQTAFSINTGGRAFIKTDFQYSYTGGGEITTNFNKNAFGLMLSSTPQWWSGTNKHFSLTNRGSAMGNTLTQSPWVETWMPHWKLGANTTDGGLSEWFSVEWELYESGGTIWGQATITDDQGPETDAQTSTPIDLGYLAGETLYAGLSTDYNDVGNVPIESFSLIDAVHIDNFSIVSVPEPGALLFGTLLTTGLGLTLARRPNREQA